MFPRAFCRFALSLGLSRRVKSGGIFGEMGKYLWYRLKEMPAGKHKDPLTNRR